MSPHLCIAGAAVAIIPVVAVVMSKPARARKLFKKAVLSLNDLAVVDIDSKKATKLKLRVNDLETPTFTLASTSQTKPLRKPARRPSSFTSVNSIIVVSDDDDDDEKNNEKKKNEKERKATIDKVNAVALVRAHISKKNNRIAGGRKRSRRIKNINDNDDVVVSDT